MTFDTIFGCAAIGAAASLAGMIWPFRRGTLGVFVNLAAGIAGGVVAGILSSLALRPEARQGNALPLFFAAVGALLVLLALHVLWPSGASPPRSPKPGARSPATNAGPADQSDVAHRRPLA